MAKARQIVKRRKAVQNVRKITQTMQLIATARFQKCLARASASKPYTQHITDMISTLAGMESADHYLLKPNPDAKRTILLVVSANRGFCGAYNTNVLKLALSRKQQLVADGQVVEIEAVGKKAVSFLRFVKEPTALTITDVEDRIAFGRVAEMAERYMKLYREGKISQVDVVYTNFISAGQQVPRVARLLPIEPPKGDDAAKAKTRPEFEFSPPPAELLQRLIPESVKVRLYQFFNEAIVSEQIARMAAMKAATDAAKDMIKYLSRVYNRARQSQITSELADIVGGAEAVS